MSRKKYIIRLTDLDREVCQETIKKLKGTSQKVRRAQMLLKADADGPAWSDAKIADAFSCRTKTVENLRQRFVERGFEQTLNRKKAVNAGAKKLLTGLCLTNVGYEAMTRGQGSVDSCFLRRRYS